MKACPYCAEQIQDAAVVCRFCGRDLPGHQSPAPSADRRQASGDEQGPSLGLIGLLGAGVLLAIVAVVVVAMRGGDASGPLEPSPSAAASSDGGAPALVPGQWVVDRAPDRDGTRTDLAMVASFDQVPGASARPALALRCVDGTADVYLTWFITLGSAVSVTTRVDDGTALSGPWSVSTDQQSTFFDGDAAALLAAWQEGERLVAEVMLPGQRGLAASFDLTGLPAALAGMPDGCGAG